MKVFVLTGYVPYEDSFVLGVYSTEEKAKIAETEWKDTDPDMGYDIVPWEVK